MESATPTDQQIHDAVQRTQQPQTVQVGDTRITRHAPSELQRARVLEMRLQRGGGAIGIHGVTFGGR